MAEEGHASRRPASAPARLLTAVAASVLLTGCATATDEDLQAVEARLDRVESALAAGPDGDELTSRLVTVEDRLDELTASLDTDELAERTEATDAQLAELVDTLTVMDEELSILSDQLDDAEGELATALSDLRSVVDGVRGGLDEVRADNDELRALIITVRDRLDRCQADGSC